MFYKVIRNMKYLTIKGLNELQMPVFGLGTWCSSPIEIENSIQTALECGYRHIDTAFTYNNEESIGTAIKKWINSGKGQREDLFITTKLPHFGNRAKDVQRFLKMSLQRLQLDYIDLYLIHMPFSFDCDEYDLKPKVKEDGCFVLDYNNNFDTWKEMEQLVHNGLAKAIGLSNFNAKQIEGIYNSATIKPTVLQVEMNAYFQQKQLLEFCKEHDIVVTAYAPLGSPAAAEHFVAKYNYSIKDTPALLTHPIVNEIAVKHNKQAAQILLKYLIQQDIVVIPKSVNPQRIKDNFNVFDFELTTEDMELLSGLDQGERGRNFDFLFFKGAEKHPEYPFELIK